MGFVFRKNILGSRVIVMASALELENYVLKEKDRLREVLSDRFGVRDRDIVVEIENVMAGSYAEFEESMMDRGGLKALYKFKFRVALRRGEDEIDLGFLGLKLVRRAKGDYVGLLYIPSDVPKDYLEGCAEYYYDIRDVLSYERTMREISMKLSNVVGLLLTGKDAMSPAVEEEKVVKKATKSDSKTGTKTASKKANKVMEKVDTDMIWLG